MNNDIPTVRLARESDRPDIARCIAEGFEKDFSLFSTDVNTVAEALAEGIHPERFYVASLTGSIIAVAGISVGPHRAVSTHYRSLRMHFGLLKGTLAKLVLRPEFECRLPYPDTTGFIEFVAVRKKFRRQGIATWLLKEAMKQAGFQTYVLDVIEKNTPALSCYEKLGFQTFKKKKKHNGYTTLLMQWQAMPSSHPDNTCRTCPATSTVVKDS